MDDILLKYPRWLVVGGALAIGLIVILIIQPPYSKCDAQYEAFKKNQTPFLFKDPQKKFDVALSYENISKKCLGEKLPGSCLKFFEGLQRVLGELDSISYECTPEIIKKSEIKKILLQSLEIIFRVAWGAKAPDSYLDRTNWYQTIELNTFCELQAYIKNNLPESEWESFRENLLQDFIQSSGLDRKEVWNRSLFTLKCN